MAKLKIQIKSNHEDGDSLDFWYSSKDSILILH
jgi:hypothetical protein